MSRHWITDSNDSLCEHSGQDDVYTSGETVSNGPQPNDYCSGCMAVEPEWTHATDEEFRDLLNHIF